MNGQWMGQYTGSNTGFAIINVDDRSDHYEGVAYVFTDGKSLPIVRASFRTNDKNKVFSLNKLRFDPINRETGNIESWDSIKQNYEKDIVFSNYVDVKGNWNEEKLSLTWKTELGFEGICELSRSKADKPSELIPHAINNWIAYKEHAAILEPRRFIFRGQKKPWRLRTKFHRTGRADLDRFIYEDRIILYKYLSARTYHIFDLDKPDENGAFFNLVQHHGYPTPLLDWTYSPYVATFFAYRDITNSEASKAAEDDKVRIFIFDQQQWENDYAKSLVLTVPYLHVSVMEFIAINNERMIPQQAVTTTTNIDDIEAYIKRRETEKNKEYLYVIDLPARDRKSIMRELSIMGITAGSMFPGLDGMCEELKERYFQI